MAYTPQLNSGGSILQEDIRAGFVIPLVEYNLVGKNFVRYETINDSQSVKIWGVGDVDTVDYTGSNYASTEATDTSVTLILNKAKFFSKQIDRIDQNMEDVTAKILGIVLEKGALSMADDVDMAIFSELATTTSTVPTIALNEANIKGFILSLKTKLDNLKAPKLGRVLGVTPEIGAILSGLNMTFNDSSNVDESIKSGLVARFAGFDIFETINLADGVPTNSKSVIACHPSGAYAGIGYQEIGLKRPLAGFKDLAEGLINYGVEIAEPKFVVKCDATLA